MSMRASLASVNDKGLPGRRGDLAHCLVAANRGAAGRSGTAGRGAGGRGRARRGGHAASRGRAASRGAAGVAAGLQLGKPVVMAPRAAAAFATASRFTALGRCTAGRRRARAPCSTWGPHSKPGRSKCDSRTSTQRASGDGTASRSRSRNRRSLRSTWALHSRPERRAPGPCSTWGPHSKPGLRSTTSRSGGASNDDGIRSGHAAARRSSRPGATAGCFAALGRRTAGRSAGRRGRTGTRGRAALRGFAARRGAAGMHAAQVRSHPRQMVRATGRRAARFAAASWLASRWGGAASRGGTTCRSGEHAGAQQPAAAKSVVASTHTATSATAVNRT